MINEKNHLIAIPESRQLNILAKLLENRGAQVMRVPLIAIHDASNTEELINWLEEFIHSPPEIFIIFTGEGLRRLLSLAERHSLKQPFIEALSTAKKLCRGPKPARELRVLEQSCDIEALAPTTDGVIETLESLSINGRKIAVQLYGEEPNLKLMDYLTERGALVSTVAPYVYANQAEEGKVVELIEVLAKGEISAIAFTSQAQFQRLLKVAKTSNTQAQLLIGLGKTIVAAIGPLVKQSLEDSGVRVDVMPEKHYFMKPLVSALLRELG